MVSKQEVVDLITKFFPKCPLCKAEANYEISGIAKNYFKCLSCGTKWATVRKGLDSLKEMRLWETPKDGRGSHVLRKKYPIDFWLHDFNPSIGVCPKCSTHMVWICSKCRNKVVTTSNCPKCGNENPVMITCSKCSTLLLNERGKLSTYSEKKAKKLPEDMLKQFPTCKFCNQRIFSGKCFPFGDGTNAHSNCVGLLLEAQKGVCLGCNKPIDLQNEMIVVTAEKDVLHSDCGNLFLEKGN